jgi:hypothetical protein
VFLEAFLELRNLAGILNLDVESASILLLSICVARERTAFRNALRVISAPPISIKKSLPFDVKREKRADLEIPSGADSAQGRCLGS